MNSRPNLSMEWPTLVLIAVAYAGFLGAAFGLYPVAPVIAWGVMALCATLHSSLSHEVLHGHPFRTQWLNEALIFPALGLFVPYLRFKDTHLAHHYDEYLTDPYDDPESNYFDPAHWVALPMVVQWVLRINNTLLGRIVVGPMVSLIAFYGSDLKMAIQGNRRILVSWAMHIPAVGMVGYILTHWAQVALWYWVASSYAAMGILKIRTFLEHQAHDKPRGRTVVIEDRGPLALLFLNNNYHAVHHAHPKVAWYKLPQMFETGRDTYLSRNFGYYYKNYAQIFARHLLRAKDPVPHPLRPVTHHQMDKTG